MPKASYFFDAIIRQEPIDEEKLDVKDNLEEFGLVTERELDFWKEATRNARATGKAVIAGLGGTALGDIALVPGIQMKHPKGIRDTQRTLPFGTPDDVRREIRFMIDTFDRPDGGCMIALGNVVTNDVPLENVHAMFDEAYHYGLAHRKA